MWTLVWHSLVGLVLLTGATIAGVVIIAKAIAVGAAHDQNRCQCVDCTNRRRRSWDAREQRQAWDRLYKEPDTKHVWMSTEQLTTGVYVWAKDHRYMVTELQVIPDYGTSVHLVDMKTRVNTFVMIKDVRRKIWKRIPWEGE